MLLKIIVSDEHFPKAHLSIEVTLFENVIFVSNEHEIFKISKW